MKTQLFIPDKLKVGYQNRGDTYTGKLAYVIYFDNKGVLRKEAGWKNWIDKGNSTGQTYVQGKGHINVPENIREPLSTNEFDNIPTEGFVLNKKAGGTKSDWNTRATYCRVYDPRGFEFEITIPNLLFILSETNCYKGKGLEGEFVYSWDGADLVLLPVGCNDYKECKKYTVLQSGKIGVKDLMPGCSYQTKKQESLVYLGKFSWYEYKSVKSLTRKYGYDKVMKETKQYVFQDIYFQDIYLKYGGDGIICLAGLTSLASRDSDIPVSNYAELMEKFSKNKHLSKPVGLESFSKKNINFDLSNQDPYSKERLYLSISKETYKQVQIIAEFKYNHVNKEYLLRGYYFSNGYNISFIENKLNIIEAEYGYGYSYYNSYDRKYYDKEQILAMNFLELKVVLENGEKVNFENFQK